MYSQELIGLNTKWYRFQEGLTQERFCDITGFKEEYLSAIENGHENITCATIDLIADALKINVHNLFIEETANKARDLPKRVDMYKKDDNN